MGQNIVQKKPVGGINADAAPFSMKDTEARYLLNFERLENSTNPSGGNAGSLTPIKANRATSVRGLPIDSCTTGFFESERTREGYAWVYCASAPDIIYRVNSDLTTTIVYQGDLNLSPDPRHAIRGAFLFYINERKYLVWTDGLNWQGFLDVETSIATNSFSVPYFQRGTYDPRQYAQLPTRPPMTCVSGEWISIGVDDESENSKRNFLLDATIQFRTKFIYTDGRESEWSPISSAFYVLRTDKQKSAKGLPRGIRLRIAAGHPQVEKIVLAFRFCNGNAYAETNPHDFFQFDVIEKYAECQPGKRFWEREMRADTAGIIYDAASNEFVYDFYGDKERTPIDVGETLRTQNPCPIVSQALAVIENRLVLFNNEVSYPPVDCREVGKFTFSSTEQTVVSCTPEIVTVTFAVLIHNNFRDVNEFLYVMGGDPDAEQKHYGGLARRETFASPFDSPVPYKQSFYGRQAGWIGYVEGTRFFGITEQWQNNGKSTFRLGPERNMGDADTRRQLSKQLDRGEYWYSIGEIKVPKGTRGFIRLAAHGASPASEFANTSANVFGITSLSKYNSRGHLHMGNTDVYRKELYFDTSSGSVDLRDLAFVVLDLTGPYADLRQGRHSSAMTGYLKDRRGNPVSGAQIQAYSSRGWGGSMNTETSMITDHNGFYFASWLGGDFDFVDGGEVGMRFYVEGPECRRHLGAEYQHHSGRLPRETFEHDLVVDRVDRYEETYYTTVKIRVLDCRGVALPGVMVAASASKAQPTGTNGYANVNIRNRAWELGNGRGFGIRVVVMQDGGNYTICGSNCDFNLPSWTLNMQPCFIAANGGPIEFNPGYTIRLTASASLGRGLKTGGRYGFAPVFHDATGRHTFIPQEASYLTLPTVQEKQGFTFSVIHFSIQASVRLPAWVRYLSFYRTGNLAFNFYIQWSVDKVTFVDSEGRETAPQAADRIYLTIQSLIDFNAKNAFATNSGYQFVKGDRVQVLTGDKGSLYPRTQGALDFLILGDRKAKLEEPGREAESIYQIIIANDERLAGMKEGALIQITRAPEGETTQMFFEMCPRIDVVDGVPQVLSGELATFDTYHVQPDVVFMSQKRTLTFPFEHHSPSYHWGSRCDDRGRVNVKNEWEQEMTYVGSAYISDAFLENGNRLGISTFRESLVKYFKVEGRGGITYAYAYHRTIRIFCEQGSFLAAVSDDFVRLGRDGTLQAAGASEIIAEMNNGSSPYGLDYEDEQPIATESGRALWLDRRSAAIVMDSQQGVADASSGKMGAHMASKCVWMASVNRQASGLKKIRAVMGYDAPRRKAMLTFFAGSYVSTRIDLLAAGTETIGIYMDDGALFMQPFTPEAYGRLGGSREGSVFFSFRGGHPWVHGEASMKQYGHFFGEGVDQVVKLVIGNDPGKGKHFISFQQHSTMKYYMPLVVTTGSESESGTLFRMESEVPPVNIRLSGGRWNGSFLFNKHTPGVKDALYNGEAMKGDYAEITLIRDNLINDNLTSLDLSKRFRYSELEAFYFLYAFVEQSAYNQT